MTSADASRPERRLPWRVAAWAWLAICLVVAVHQFSFWRSTHFDTDVMALLPQDEQAPEVGRATRQLADQVTRQVVVMIGAPDWAGARKAADAWERAAMPGDRATAPPPLRRSAMASDASLRDTLAFYAPYRDRLLTPAQRAELELAPPGALVQGALGALAQPGGGFRLADWNADPLALWPQWWLARASDTRARPRDGQLALRDGGLEWVVLLEETTGAAFSLSGDEPVSDVVEKGREAARAAVPGARVLAGGVPLFAEHAAARAHLEVNTIGWGSVGGVLVLVFLAFRSLWPRLLMALSLLVGVAMALSATAWVFGHVHLLTTVFGASLVGCAEDYGLYYFASRQGAPAQPPLRLMGTLLPGLGLALLTSVLGYVALGLPPFPGLRQMALFSVVGIAGAFMTTVCWFPWIDRGSVRATRFSAWIVDSFPRYPRFAAGRGAWLMHAAVLAACAIGIAQLRVDDDLRQLQGSPKTLVDTQREIGRLLGLASPAQFFVVRGSSADDVLRREEALKARLDARVANGELAGYRALSDWVPSAARQAADAALTKRVEDGVIAGVDQVLGETQRRAPFDAAPLTLDKWLASPASAAGRALWIGAVPRADDGSAFASVVMLRGVRDLAALPGIATSADGLPGVRWVDQVQSVSALLGRYRHMMGLLLVAGHVAVLLALAWRYGRRAWRAWMPTAMATVGTLALLALAGQPLQLFNVLALALLLGIGIDYGIFLLEREDAGAGSAWLSVVLGAASTWLSFGLLALSSTPALHSFGLTLLFGILIVGLASPLYRPPAARLRPSIESSDPDH
ncbi:MAG: MMPL family transporter [Burkholderiaceae bacterium]